METLTTKDFESHLGDYTVVVHDPGSNEPVAWGRLVIKTVGPAHWHTFRRLFKVDRTNPGEVSGQYYVILKELSRTEAIEKYGPVTGELYGPRGGFKWAKFGNKTFYAKSLSKNYTGMI